jgi:hypothetical protein
MRAVGLLRARNDELARLETLDTGKPIAETRSVLPALDRGSEAGIVFEHVGTGDDVDAAGLGDRLAAPVPTCSNTMPASLPRSRAGRSPCGRPPSPIRAAIWIG